MIRFGNILLIVFSIGFVFETRAQCVPETNFTELYKPALEDILPEATLFFPYEVTIHVNVPSDTSFEGSPQVHLDSIVLQSVTGIPEGLGFECNTPRCVLLGGEYGCIRIFGTPDNENDVGDNPLTVNFAVHAGFLSVAQPLEGYSIRVNPDTTNGTAVLDKSTYILKMDQNPSNKFSKLIYTLPTDKRVSLKVFSLLGSEVIAVEAIPNGKKGILALGKYGLTSGVYFAVISQDDYSNSMRFVVQ
jgi:hypothetical protein